MSIIGGPLPKNNETVEKEFIPAIPTEFPSFKQIKAYEDLIKINPAGKKWQLSLIHI